MSWSNFLARLSAALADPGTVFFADTSFLFSTASLNAGARAEVGAWMAALGPERFLIPAWVAQEVFRRLSTDQSPFTPMRTTAAEITGRLDELRAEARRFVDDAVASSYSFASPGRRDRGSFLIGLDREVASLERRLRHLKDASSRSLDDSADFLSAIINAHLMPSDVYGSLHTLEAEYQARLVGDHPPGYKDRRKDANRYGDLLIWREIVAYCTRERPLSVIMCTNDLKPDWAFTPPMMIDDVPGVPPERRQQPNKGQRGFQIILPQPLLVHELGRDVPDFSLHLMTSQMLARLSSTTGAMPALVQAYSQIAEAADAPQAEEHEGATGTGDGVEGQGTAALSQTPPSLAQVRASLADPDLAVTAVADVNTLLAAGTLSQSEVRGLGRAIAEAAENGPEAIELLGRALLDRPQSNDAQWSALYEGALLGTYLKEDGRPRTRPLLRLLGPLFAAAGSDAARSAAERLRAELGTARLRYALLPGEAGVVDVSVVSLGRQPDGTRLGGLTYGETQLLIDGRRQNPNSLYALSGGQLSATVNRFKQLLSGHFRVPEERITLNLASADRVSWDEVQTLIDWSADAGPQLR